MTGLG